MKRLIFLATLALAAPAAAQFSEGYNFLKAVRDRDGAKVQEVTSLPNNVINTRENATGEGALHILVRGRDATWLAFLLGRGARPDIQDHRGVTPLSIAAEIGFLEGAELLLKKRALVDLPNGSGETPLIKAVQRRDPKMVRLLMLNGANPDKTDSSAGLSARDYATRDRRAAAVLRIIEDAKATMPVAAGPKR